MTQSEKGKKRNKKGITRLVLLLILGCCLFTSIFCALGYGISSIRFMEKVVADEMRSRTRSLSRMMTRYLEGDVVRDTFMEFYRVEQKGITVYVYDAQGTYIGMDGDSDDGEAEAFHDIVTGVLSGEEDSVQTDMRHGIIAVGVPVNDSLKRTIGVLVLAKPSQEVKLASKQLLLSLVMSTIAAAALMAVPAGLLSHKIVQPVRSMTKNASRMAEGDFSARADEHAYGEIGTLGLALNALSANLNETISDLTETRNHLETILASMGDGILTLSKETGKVTFINEACRSFFQEEDIVAFTAENREKLFGSACVEEGEAFSWKLRDSIYSVFTTAFQNRDGSQGIICMFHDVTEAEKLEQTRREFVANVSHELKTPIASIRSLAETLNDGIVTSEEDVSRYYGYILRESARLSRLINDLLELSRLQSGTVFIKKETFDLRKMLEDVTDRMETVASYSGLNVLLSVQEGMTTCYSNRDRVEQVMVTLLDNAIKYAEDDTDILVTAESVRKGTESFCCLCVCNNGHIDEKDLPHLFERFYKADKSHSGNGTGLGLAIAKEIVSLLDGTISVRNSEGKVIFSVLIPQAQEENRCCGGDSDLI